MHGEDYFNGNVNGNGNIFSTGTLTLTGTVDELIVKNLDLIVVDARLKIRN